ncbi:MAG: UPF0182 family protein, partial [Acetobacteraceae bacterium]|nr:UPF0182 family protein [Acetobacteraceae bacterium]
MFRRITLIGFGALVLVLILLSSVGSYIYTEWLWFRSLGQAAVFSTALGSRAAVGAVAGGLFALLLYLILWLGRRSLPLEAQAVGPPLDRLLQPRRLDRVFLGLSLFLGLLVGLSSSGQWLTFQAFLHRVEFGVAEPVFGLDAGFYVFVLPIYSFFYRLGGLLFWVSVPVMLFVLLLTGGLEFPRGRVRLARGARIYLSLVAAGFFVYKALGYRLAMFRLLYSPRGVVFGASYTDVHASLPALWALVGISLVAAGLAAATAFRRDHRLLLAGVGLLVGVSLLLGTAYPLLVQQFAVSPNEIARERPYIENNIRLTRHAYDLDRIGERPFSADENLGREDLDRNRDTVDNVRLWDWRPLQQTYSQLQEIRLYYNFADVDVDRYVVDGRPRQVLLSAREINQEQLPQQARTWVNLHLKYTHGYGAVVSPATEFTAEGMPVLWVRDIPPQTDAEPLKISRPEIYYGEQTTGY